MKSMDDTMKETGFSAPVEYADFSAQAQRDKLFPKEAEVNEQQRYLASMALSMLHAAQTRMEPAFGFFLSTGKKDKKTEDKTVQPEPKTLVEKFNPAKVVREIKQAYEQKVKDTYWQAVNAINENFTSGPYGMYEKSYTASENPNAVSEEQASAVLNYIETTGTKGLKKLVEKAKNKKEKTIKRGKLRGKEVPVNFIERILEHDEQMKYNTLGEHNLDINGALTVASIREQHAKQALSSKTESKNEVSKPEKKYRQALQALQTVRKGMGLTLIGASLLIACGAGIDQVRTMQQNENVNRVANVDPVNLKATQTAENIFQTSSVGKQHEPRQASINPVDEFRKQRILDRNPNIKVNSPATPEVQEPHELYTVGSGENKIFLKETGNKLTADKIHVEIPELKIDFDLRPRLNHEKEENPVDMSFQHVSGDLKDPNIVYVDIHSQFYYPDLTTEEGRARFEQLKKERPQDIGEYKGKPYVVETGERMRRTIDGNSLNTPVRTAEENKAAVDAINEANLRMNWTVDTTGAHLRPKLMVVHLNEKQTSDYYRNHGSWIESAKQNDPNMPIPDGKTPVAVLSVCGLGSKGGNGETDADAQARKDVSKQMILYVAYFDSESN